MTREEQYVTYKTAKLLKEKRFDWECLARYDKPILSNNVSIFTEENAIDWNTYYYGSDYKCSAPTQQMAMRWLREEKGIHISADIYKDSSNDADNNIVEEWTYWAWDFYWLPSGNLGDEGGCDQFDSYEDAIEAALEYVLTNLI